MSNDRMPLRALLPLLAALFLLAPAAQAQPAQDGSPRAMIRLRDASRLPPPASIGDLAWLEGHWVGEMPEGPVEHVVLGAAFGHMPGFVRAVSPTNVIFYEISTFAEAEGSLTVRVKHFTPQLAGWEAQDAFIDRPLVAREGGNFYFDGFTMVRTGPDSFTVYFLNRTATEERDTLVIPSGGNSGNLAAAGQETALPDCPSPLRHGSPPELRETHPPVLRAQHTSPTCPPCPCFDAAAP